jgi:hypothetical protein
MGQKHRRRNTDGPKRKRKNEIKIWKDYWAVANWKFDSNDF